MRELIIGSEGFIGRALARHLPDAQLCHRNKNPLAEGHYLDLLNPDNPPDADIVYICAGVNGMVACSKNPQVSWRINVDGTIKLAEHYRKAHVVWISSTTVEWSSDAYGTQKRIAETVLRSMSHVACIRAGRVVQGNVDNLCQTMIKAGKHRLSGVILWGEEEPQYDHGAPMLRVAI